MIVLDIWYGDGLRVWVDDQQDRAKAKERRTENPNKFDGIQLNEYRVFATVPFIDKIFTNIETIY